LRNQEQVDTYLVHKTTDLDEKVVEDLSEDIRKIPNDRLESVISYLEKKVADIIREFRTDPQGTSQKQPPMNPQEMNPVSAV
jgi:hypothetical protein